jgi:hypothetical protein
LTVTVPSERDVYRFIATIRQICLIAISPSNGKRGPTDLQFKARWAAGRSTVIAKRRLDTHRPDDVVIGNGTFIWWPSSITLLRDTLAIFDQFNWS